MLAWLAAISLGAPQVDGSPAVRVVVGSAACAGAIVDDAGRVLTAYHCVSAGGRARITTREGDSVWGRVRAWDVAGDLAVIEAPALAGSAFLTIARAVPTPGDPITVVGHPFGGNLPSGYFEGLLRWSIASGVVSGVGKRAIQFDAPVNPGNSGGPVLDADDRIVSVVSRRLGGQGVAFGARTERIADVLAAPARRPGVGGQLQIGVRLGVLQSVDGGVAAGPWAEISLRDRVFVGGSGLIPVAPAVSAARFGSASFSLGEGHLGVRQRIGTGAWCVRLDALGGLAAVGTWTGEITADRLAIRSATRAPWMAGGAVGARGLRFGLAVLGDESLLTALEIAWPGTVSVW